MSLYNTTWEEENEPIYIHVDFGGAEAKFWIKHYYLEF